MGYFIGPDGRVQFAKEEINELGQVKLPGSASIGSYNSFHRDSGSSSSSSKNTTKSQVKTPCKPVPHQNESQIIRPWQYEMMSKGITISSTSNKKQSQKRKKKDSTIKYKRDKSVLQKIRSALSDLLEGSHLSPQALAFVEPRIMMCGPIKIKNKLRNRLRSLSLEAEEDTIIHVIESANSIIRQINATATFVSVRIASPQKGTVVKKLIIPSSAQKTDRTSPKKEKNNSLKPTREFNPNDRDTVGTPTDTIYTRKGKTPQFGYGRDYFGRVLERDSYREDRPVNPYHSRSDYDREDDNESLDNLD